MTEPKPIPLGAQLISLEIAVVALLQVIGRIQPAAAHIVAETMQNVASLVPEKQFPGVCEKVEQYLEVIEAEMAARNELPPAIASAPRKTKRALQ